MPVLVGWEILGLVVSIFAALITWHSSKATATREKASEALLAATMGIVFTLLLVQRFEYLPKIAAAIELEMEIDEIKDARTVLSTMSAVQERRLTRAIPLWEEDVDRKRHRFLADLELAQGGVFEWDTSDLNEFAPDLIARAKETIKATSFVSKDKWWEGRMGDEYTKQNSLAINRERPVIIDRTFIFASIAEKDEATKLLTDQVCIGVNVSIAWAEELEGVWLQDMILIDDTFSGVLQLSELDRSPQMAIFSTKEDDLKKVRRKFDMVERAATELLKKDFPCSDN